MNNMIKRSTHYSRVLWRMLPRQTRIYIAEHYVTPWRVRRASRSADQMTHPAQWLEIVRSHWPLHAEQKESEILGLINKVIEQQPKYLCEVGTARGGTLFMLMRASQADATIISVDLGNSRTRAKIFTAGKKPKQQVHILQANSHEQKTVELIRQKLNGASLDFLFIDGDHSLEGVKADFEMYSPLVRPGGIIGFHDIMPDYKSSKGIDTGRKAGDVPAFWASIKSRYVTEELIDSKTQDGYGIGIIYW